MAFSVAHLSDPHVVEPGRLLADVIDTAAHLATAVETVGRLAPAPDAVLLTGDLVDSGRVAQYEHLRTLLAPLQAPVVLVPGNHDARGPLREVFPELAPPRSDGRLDGARLDGEVALVWLDTLVDGRPGGDLTPEQLDWLDAMLASAADRPVLLALHHPPFATGIAHMDAMGLDPLAAERLGDVVERHPNVERVACGHLHRSIVRRWRGTVVGTVPSTCHAVALDLDGGVPTWTTEPPAVTVHWWSPTTGLVTHQRASGGYPPTPY